MQASASRPTRADERGVVLVLFAVVLVVLLVFAAMVVDIGAVASARREDQNGADAGALSGVQDLSLSDAVLIATVKGRVHETLDVTFTDAEWNSCGTSSTTGDPDSVDTIVGGLSCITVNANGAARRQLQVRIPTQTYRTSFGHIVGVDTFTHSAFAIAGFTGAGFGSILPYGVPASSGGQTQGCLKAGPTPHSEYPCNGPASGAFGMLDFTYFGDDTVGTIQTCNGDVNNRIAHNTAAGIDHDLTIYAGAEVRDTVECGSTENRPNTVPEESGNRVEAFGRGIYSADDFRGTNETIAYDGRLRQPTTGLSWDTPRTIDGHTVDNAPLWEFIEPLDEDGDGLSVPDSCAKSVFTQALSGDYSSLPEAPANVRSLISTRPTQAERMRLLLDRCITHYRGEAWNANGAITGVADPTSCPNSGCDDPVFARNSSTTDSPDLYDIQYTPRFGYVPQLTTDFGSPASNPNMYRIATFRAVFIQRVVGSCNASGCDLDFEPGVTVVGDDAPTNGGAEAMSAFLFPATILPNGLSGPGAPYEIGVNRFIRLIR